MSVCISVDKTVLIQIQFIPDDNELTLKNTYLLTTQTSSIVFLNFKHNSFEVVNRRMCIIA